MADPPDDHSDPNDPWYTARPSDDPDAIDPWAESDDSGDSEDSEEDQGGIPEIPDDGRVVPTLTVTWDAPPPLDQAAPQSQDDAPSESTGAPFSIDLGTLQDAQGEMLNGLREIVEAYNTLKEATQEATGNQYFFGPAPQDDTVSWGGYYGSTYSDDSEEVNNNKISANGQRFAAEMVPDMQGALMNIGNAIETSSLYVGRLNKAGQAYAQADRAAYASPPPPPPRPVAPAPAEGGPPADDG